MTRVAWTETALVELEAIRAYLLQFNPTAANRVAHALIAAGNRFSILPHRGRRVPGTDQRELVADHSYIVRYRVYDGGVEILRIRHSSRRPTVP